MDKIFKWDWNQCEKKRDFNFLSLLQHSILCCWLLLKCEKMEARIQIKLIFDLFYAASNNSSLNIALFLLFISFLHLLEIGIQQHFSTLLSLTLFFIIINCFLVHVLFPFWNWSNMFYIWVRWVSEINL
jgi:hypothetical protein